MPNSKAQFRSDLGRREFFKGAGLTGIGAAGLALGFDPLTPRADAETMSPDSVQQIVTAALVAEDLATTFYYNALTGKVIQDPALAGSGGGITRNGGLRITNGNAGNVKYLQAALSEEIAHANLLRGLLGQSSSSTDPYQRFYFPSSTFSSLNAFIATLEALENAFIGAYLNAVREFSELASHAAMNPSGQTFTADQLTYYAVVAASILGVESEHRTLGRVIAGFDPANNLNYEQYDGLTSVYNGSTSAVAALTPFLSASSGEEYSLQTALANANWVSIAVQGGPPQQI